MRSRVCCTATDIGRLVHWAMHAWLPACAGLSHNSVAPVGDVGDCFCWQDGSVAVHAQVTWGFNSPVACLPLIPLPACLGHVCLQSPWSRPCWRPRWGADKTQTWRRRRAWRRRWAQSQQVRGAARLCFATWPRVGKLGCMQCVLTSRSHCCRQAPAMGAACPRQVQTRAQGWLCIPLQHQSFLTPLVMRRVAEHRPGSCHRPGVGP